MSKLFTDNKQMMIHILSEVVVLIGLTFYFNQKNKKLMAHIEDIAQRIEEQEDLIQKHEQILKQVVAHIGNHKQVATNSTHVQTPPQHPQYRKKRTKRRINKPSPPPPTPSAETNTPPSKKGPVRVHFDLKLEESESESESELDLDVELEEELNDLVESNDNLKKESPVVKRNDA